MIRITEIDYVIFERFRFPERKIQINQENQEIFFQPKKNENSLFFQNQSSSGLQSKVTNRKENQKMNDPICCLVNLNGNQKPKQTKRYHGNI